VRAPVAAHRVDRMLDSVIEGGAGMPDEALPRLRHVPAESEKARSTRQNGVALYLHQRLSVP